MTLNEILSTILELSKSVDMERPYIAGGIVRDKALGVSPIVIADIDITTNTPESLRLAVMLADKFGRYFKIFENGHITVYFENVEIDFSSHFISDNIVNYLNNKDIYDEKMYEVYSRDFTINALHQDIETGKIIDFTGSGVDDAKDRFLRCVGPPDITLSDDPRRIFRAISLSARYSLKVDDLIINFVKNNLEVLHHHKLKDRYISLEIDSALEKSPKTTIQLLKDMDLFDRIPLSGKFKQYLINNKMLLDYL